MAKKAATEEAQVQNPNEEMNNEGTQNGGQQEQPQEQPQEQQAPQAPKAPKAAVQAPTNNSVKIHTLEEVNCVIAGIPYVFAKGKDAKVPSDVAAILTNSQKAYRI